MITQVRAGLAKTLTPQLVDELIEAYREAKEKFHAGGLRLSEVEGGRFCEAAFRILEERTTGKYTPLSKRSDIDKLITTLSNILAGTHPDSVRLHIPRALRVVYDVRNNRDAAHLADGIDPNLQDATLVVSIVDWVMAEFVRLHCLVPADEAQRIVDNLVTRRAPAVQDFNGFLKVLNPKLRASEHCLLLLYQRGGLGATFAEVETWSLPSMRRNLRRTLTRLTHERLHVHFDGERYYITIAGIQAVEESGLHRPST